VQNQQAPQESLFTVAQVSLLAVAQIGFILFLLVAIVLIAVLVIRTGVGSRSVSQGERSWMDYGSFFVVTWGIVAVIIGFLSILLFLDRFTNITQALGFLTALFGAIVGLVGTYFGVKTSSDAREGAQQLAAASGGDATKPQVLSNTPPDQDMNVPTDVHPTATFSKDMDSSTINPATFKLLDQATLQQVPPSVPDGVHYDEPTKVATFTPAVDLQSGRTYEATITSGVKDKAGNTLAQDHVWHFTVS
jgi:Big-like domain-containing protein